MDRRIRWHYTTTILRLRIGARLTRYRNCKFHNFARTISRHADGISRYSVPPSAGPLLPLQPPYMGPIRQIPPQLCRSWRPSVFGPHPTFTTGCRLFRWAVWGAYEVTALPSWIKGGKETARSSGEGNGWSNNGRREGMAEEKRGIDIHPHEVPANLSAMVVPIATVQILNR